jgi:hypothetical protein
MTYVETAAAALIFSLFISGLGRAVQPALKAYNHAAAEYMDAKALEFVSESFKMECRKKGGDIERWKKIISIVPQIDMYDIKVFYAKENVIILQLICIIRGERFEILGLRGL